MAWLRGLLLPSHHENVFVQGFAGAGKSHLVRTVLLPMLAAHFACPVGNLEQRGVYVTSTTSKTASELGGVTIHSWGGIRTGTDTLEVLIERMSKCGARAVARHHRADCR